MRFPLLISSLLVAAALAGCTGNGAKQDLANDPGETVNEVVNSLEGYVNPFLLQHDHADAKLHALEFHVKQLSHHPLGGNVLKSSGAHVVDVRGNWLFVGAYGLVADVDGGVWIYDITNPEAPKFTGQLRLPGNVGGDRSMEATDDGNWVVLGTESIDCANHVNPFGPGLYLIDARDKANPQISDYFPSAFGVHSVVVHRIDGKDYAVTLGASDGGKNIREIDTAAGKFKAIGRVPISHDGTAYDDPLLNKTILAVTGESTFEFYDWSTPASPKKLGSWSPPDARDHYMHQAAIDVVEGRRIVVLESEDWGDAVSPVWIVDATDFKAMELLSTWTNPANATAGANSGEPSLAFSTHNPRMENGILYLAHYHGGVWMLDLRTLNKAHAPEVMGYFLPHEDNGGYKPASSQSALPIPPNPICYGGFRIHELPNTMDVEVKNGVVYAADLHTGLYTLKYDVTVLPKKP